MDDKNGDGDGNPYVPIGTFNQFKEDQASLCSAYRNHFETKVTNMEESLTGKIKTVGAVVSFIVLVLTLINVYLSVVI